MLMPSRDHERTRVNGRFEMIRKQRWSSPISFADADLDPSFFLNVGFYLWPYGCEAVRRVYKYFVNNVQRPRPARTEGPVNSNVPAFSFLSASPTE